MTYMTAMDRLEMCCIFLLEGLQTVRDRTWWQAKSYYGNCLYLRVSRSPSWA